MIKLTQPIVSSFSTILQAPSIIVQYADLLSGKDIQPVIEQAYGPKGSFYLTKDSVFSSWKEFLTIPTSEKLHCPFFTNLPTSQPKNSRNIKCPRSTIAKDGHAEYKNSKANTMYQREVTMLTAQQTKPLRPLHRQTNTLVRKRRSCLVLISGLMISHRCKSILIK